MNIKAFLLLVRMFFSNFFMGLGYLLQLSGVLAIGGLFLGGIYVVFVKSIAIGLMMIGATVVGGWINQIVSGLLMAAGMGVITVGIKEE